MVAEEVEYLIKMKPICVMAHDTSAQAAGFADCDGPPYLNWRFMTDIGREEGDKSRRLVSNNDIYKTLEFSYSILKTEGVVARIPRTAISIATRIELMFQLVSFQDANPQSKAVNNSVRLCNCMHDDLLVAAASTKGKRRDYRSQMPGPNGKNIFDIAKIC